MKIQSRHHLELYLLDQEEHFILRTEMMLRDHGATDDEVEAETAIQRAEWVSIRARALRTYDLSCIDLKAAMHEVQ